MSDEDSTAAFLGTGLALDGAAASVFCTLLLGAFTGESGELGGSEKSEEGSCTGKLCRHNSKDS